MNEYPFWKSLAIVVPMLLAAALQGAAVTNLRCECRTDPLGIDVAKPRMSWVIADSQSKISNFESRITRSVAQSAYQVLVASSLELLNKDNGDFWDSGMVASHQSTQVEFQEDHHQAADSRRTEMGQVRV